MTNELKPCPCGTVPTKLNGGQINDGSIIAIGTNSCGNEFCGWVYLAASDVDMIKEWNAAPRGDSVLPAVLEYMKAVDEYKAVIQALDPPVETLGKTWQLKHAREALAKALGVEE